MIRKAGILACVLLCAGCLTPKRIVPTQYYTIDPVIDVGGAEATALTLGVRPFAVARPYDAGMAYLDSRHRLAYRVKEEWAELPRDVVTRAVMDAITATGRFADVGKAAEMSLPDLMLTGEVRKFHENRSVHPPVVELEARLELRRTRAKDPIWAETLRVEAPIADDSGDALAAAMSEAVAALARQSAENLARADLRVPETP